MSPAAASVRSATSPSPKPSRSRLPGIRHPLDLVYRAVEGFPVEEVRRRVRELMGRAVEIVRSVRRIDRVSQRDLVRDDEDARLWPVEQPPKRPSVPACRIVEGLAARKRVPWRVRPFPGAVVLDRLPLELADVDVVQERFDLERNPAIPDRDCGGFVRASEA